MKGKNFLQEAFSSKLSQSAEYVRVSPPDAFSGSLFKQMVSIVISVSYKRVNKARKTKTNH